MQLSDKTLTILKNFSTINPSLLFKKGNRIRTISILTNIMAEATVEEQFPKDFGISDLPQFLNNLDLLKQPELDFDNDGYVMIRQGKSRVKYFFSPANVIVSPPEQDVLLPSEDIDFNLNETDIVKILKASHIMQLPDLSVIGETGVIKLVVRDKKNDTSNEFSIVVGQSDEEFAYDFKVENIKILPGNYKVVISKKLFSRFENSNYGVSYLIALEP